ncbi:lamin tail domain-containing protein [Myxococcota bacterium]
MKSRLALLALIIAACGSEPGENPCANDACVPIDPCAENDGVCPDPIQINELMVKNDGAWIDEALEADDWIEITNTGDGPVSLLGYTISDRSDTFHFLPAETLEPGEVILVWADDEPEQGPDHYDFKLSSEGETVYLWSPDARLVDRVRYPAMAPNDSFARVPSGSGDFVLCRWATPKSDNGEVCGPPPPPELPVEIEFSDYEWPIPWPLTPTPLVINELALRPAGFVEVVNTSDGHVDLTAFSLSISDHAPGLPWPGPSVGTSVTWPATTLAPGERVSIEVDASAVAQIAATPDFEGVVTLWSAGDPVDRVDFMAWPEGAGLARVPDATGQLRFCTEPSPAATNDTCESVPSRTVDGRLRHLYTPGDFATLAEGGVAVGMQAVKWVVDMESGDVVHLLHSATWDLHYTFVRETIDGDPHLDRCDPSDNLIFHQGWSQFSAREYFEIETRRYLLGTFVHHAGSGIHTAEFATGDRIIASQIERAFFDVVATTLVPTEWALRPQGAYQIQQMLLLDGNAPIVDPNAPFRGVTLQPLAEGVAYGVLTFVPSDGLYDVPLGRQVVVVTDQVPNDIPLVGGLITETFQTPLAHVNVLSRNRGSPNMALLEARNDPRLAPHIDTLVRFEVAPGTFEIRPADPAEAEAFWESQLPQGDPLEPRLDTSLRGLIPLAGCTLDSLPLIGAKAAGLAELMRVDSSRSGCPGPVTVPRDPAAIALVFSLEHIQASGAAALLATAEADPTFRADPRVRVVKLAEVRSAILAHPVDATLLATVEAYISAYFGDARVRFRSSSNTEDLPGFNGAGLYTSISAETGNPERSIEDAIRTVWASLYNARAYDERRLFNVDESKVAMGILIHRAFLSEEANGVAISRNILDPIRSDQYYINTQMGEASVANPAPGVTTEQLIYRWGRSPRLVYHAYSNLPDSIPVLSEEKVEMTACTLRAIHNHFRPILDPESKNRWFAMDIELKLVGPGRTLVVKQARPYTFGNAQIPTDCREF